MNLGEINMANASVWVNKKSGTIHHVFTGKDWSGSLKLHTSTLNLRYERDYFFRKDAVTRFFKNYELIANNPSDDFFVNVCMNKKLKSDFSWGLKTNGRVGISKDEFFSKLKESN